MSLRLERSPGRTVVVISPHGELDLGAAPALRDALLDACHGKERLVVVDLRLVTFADSSAMAVLVAAHKRLSESDRGLTIVNAHGLPLKVLRLTGLTHVFDVREPGEVDEADLASMLTQ